MNRIAIVGSGGAGKSTFSRELAALTGLPVVHLDRHYWQPGWIETPVEKWREIQSKLIAGENWIADGNYYRTFDLRFGRADTVIVLAFSRYLCLFRAFSRTIRNYGKPIQSDGCPERFELEFYRWIWNFPKTVLPELYSILDSYGNKLEVIKLETPKQAKYYLESLGRL